MNLIKYFCFFILNYYVSLEPGILEQVEIKRTIPKGASQSKDFKTKKIFVGGIPSSVTEGLLLNNTMPFFKRTLTPVNSSEYILINLCFLLFRGIQEFLLQIWGSCGTPDNT